MPGSLTQANDPAEQFERENSDLPGPDSVERLLYHIHISARFKYVYVSTPKVACSSIKETLQRLELNDRTFSRPGETVHVRAYSPLLTPLQVGSFASMRRDAAVTIFCFVRNPFTRLLSAYLDKIVRDKPPKKLVLRSLAMNEAALDQPISFERFVLALEGQDVAGMDPHWRPQTLHLRIGRLHYNLIGYFESLAADLDRVGVRIGVDLSPFIKSNRDHQTRADLYLNDYYTADLVARVARLYKSDLDYFGYSAAIEDAVLPPSALG